MIAGRGVAIAGVPGAGKSTLAHGLADHYGWSVVSSGDIARRVDPEGLAAGGLADEVAFREAWADVVRDLPAGPIIFDGIPRNRAQLGLLPDGVVLFGLNVHPNIARERLLRRGRADDSPEIVDRRVMEQVRLLEMDRADGWLYRTAGWGRVIDTGRKLPGVVLDGVVAFLDGKKHDAV